MKKWQKVSALVVAAASIVATLAACGGTQTSSIDQSNPTIKIMTKSYSAEPAGESSPVYQALEEYLGVKLDVTFAASQAYDEKVTATMGAGTYPHAMLVGSKTASVIQNCRVNNFWDITDKVHDSKFPNISEGVNDTVLNNMSIDGKIYGLYRSRTLGRAGISIREDWLENLNLEEPKTIDDLYNVLKAFKEQDPDGNGQDDTYGMIVTSYSGPFDNLAVWMGAPNQYGIEDGKLKSAYDYPEYFEALKFMRKLYEEGLVNADMATFSSDDWNEPFLSSKAGVIIDVADRGRRLQQNISSITPTAKVGIIGSVAAKEGEERRVLPTTGYDGFFVFPATTVTSEEDLDFVIGVFDKMLDADAADLINYGIKDRTYTVEDNCAVVTTDTALQKEYADLNQITTLIGGKSNYDTYYATEAAKKVAEVQDDNEKYAVANPAEPYVSETYSNNGPQLDTIMTEANTKFMVGQIDEAGWKSALEQWKKQGGDKIVEELNEEYQKYANE